MLMKSSSTCPRGTNRYILWIHLACINGAIGPLSRFRAACIKYVTCPCPRHCVPREGPPVPPIQINNSGHDSSPAPPPAASSAAASKWACAMCTYLNWPKAHKCVQCYTVRKRVSPSSMSPRSATPASSASLQAAAEQHCIASMNKAFEQVILSSTQVSQMS